MDSKARRVKAERDRQRLPRRSAPSRWALRVAGLVATAAFLGVGVASALMIAPDSGGGGAALGADATPTPTPAKHSKTKAKAHKPKGPTKAQRAARTAALAEIRRQGFTTLKPSDYDYKATLRVIVGRPVGDAGGGSYAFFFLKDRFVGKDAFGPSSKLSVVKSGRTTVTLSYGTYVAGEHACCPSGRTRVRFKLEGERVQALDTIPPAGARFVRGAA
jgi:LppP/LprE lipoprotein